MDQPNLLGQTRSDLEAYFATLGLKHYRATQLMQWLYHKLQMDIDKMSNFALKLRDQMQADFEVNLPEAVSIAESKDGTVKWVLRTQSGDLIETVLIPDGHRQTLCISSQVGCALDCTFCATGKQGFNGNLTTAEIVGQVVQAAIWMDVHRSGDCLTNVVFMGMGEPLLNFEPVLNAISILMDDLGFGLSRRRVTISTAGVVPAIEKLCGRVSVALAVSLHAANDELRSELVPLNRKYPIAELLEACKSYVRSQNAKASITFEYSLIDGVNDSVALAKDLGKLVRDLPCKVNLIPFNPFPGTAYKKPTQGKIDAFRQTLSECGVRAMCRTTRGDDINAACGQLVGKVADRTRRSETYRRGENAIFKPVEVQALP